MDDEKGLAVYINPQDYYKNEMDSWVELWDEELSLYENVYNILGQAVLLPQRDLMLPIVTTYILIPSKWARVLPILFSWGGKGSGKSTTAIFAAKLHGFGQTFSATDTFAGIRNALDKMRWIDPKTKEEEKEGAILPWDNIHTGTFEKDERIYQMLLFGYSRSSDKISIAGQDGTNKEFYVFSPKIISSVDDLHLNPDLEELQRRLIVIPHKSWELFSKEEKEVYAGFDIHAHRIDLDSIHWDGIEYNFFEFWNDTNNCELYAKHWTTLARRNSKFKHNMTSTQWTISIDLIVTGALVGAWSLSEGIDHMNKYWSFANLNIFNSVSATEGHILDFIEEEVGNVKRINEQLGGKNSLPLIISAEKLHKRIQYHKLRGELDLAFINQAEINRVMSKLGWRLTTKGWVEKK